MKKNNGIIVTTLDIPSFFSSWFYKNCKRQRKNKAKICNECPFCEGIKDLERNVKTNID